MRSANSFSPLSAAPMPPSIRPRNASGKISVATAAITRKNTASAMRPQYGRKKGTRPDKERGDPLAGAELEAGVDGEGAVEVTIV